MIEFTLGGNKYRSTKLTAMQQLHVHRRLAPLIPTLLPIVMLLAQDVERDQKRVAKGEKPASKGAMVMQNIGVIPKLAQPFMDGLASMKDEAAEFVVNTCMSVVQREKDGNWIAAWNVSGKVGMFPDLNDIAALLPIIFKVVQDNLGNFMNALNTNPLSADETA